MLAEELFRITAKMRIWERDLNESGSNEVPGERRKQPTFHRRKREYENRSRVRFARGLRQDRHKPGICIAFLLDRRRWPLSHNWAEGDKVELCQV